MGDQESLAGGDRSDLATTSRRPRDGIAGAQRRIAAA
jgi:hypothetical protein